MSKYTITHGSIAAVQYVTYPDGNKVIVTDARDGSEIELPKLPLEVQVAVNRQFEAIFALPYDSRQGFIDNSIPFEVEVTE
jgi:CO dehydrogenase/acetyl-CoA synthase alpha subunit